MDVLEKQLPVTGTKMTTEEFLALPESNQRIELINGEVVMRPAPELPHQRLSRRLTIVLDALISNGEIFHAPFDVHFSDGSVAQPDLVWISEDGPAEYIDDEKRIQGAPNLAIEILSPGSIKRDRGEKYELYQLYQQQGVAEYWIADPREEYIEVFVLTEGVFVRQGLYDAAQTFASPVLGGKSVDMTTLFPKG